MEVVFRAGCYNVMAMLTNAFGIEIETDSGADEMQKALRQYT